MTKEEIISMARDAGMTGLDSGGLLENFERFAALVAAAEREACAEAAEEWLPDSFEEITQVAIAAEIRERGQE